jgi:succinate dehydrogenase/fumarate reductase cytochrome b subunit
MFQELLAALDSSLVRGKLRLAAAAAFLGGLLIAVLQATPLDTLPNGQLLGWGVGGVLLLLLFAVTSALITQMTYVELSRLRPARPKEIRAVLGLPAVRLAAVGLLIAGLLLAIAGLRLLPPWLLQGIEGSEVTSLRGALPAVAAVAELLLEVVLWPLAVLGLLLAPILIVEDCSVFTAVRQWVALLGKHRGRLVLYEVLAVAFGGLATLALALPLIVASQGIATDERLAFPVGLALRPLWGLALAPLLAYLTVANVFIYLNLRYPGAHRTA